jgi:photosystem II stability/assembly factor-like uncharacterized protein
VNVRSSAYADGVPALAAVEFTSPEQGWAAGSAGILATSDGGATWRGVYRAPRGGGGPDKLYEVDFTDAAHGWAVGTSAVLSTSDGGRTWTRRQEPCGLIDSVHFLTPGLGYAISGAASVSLNAGMPVAEGGGRVLRTTDGGRTWNPVATAPVQAESVCFANASDGFLGLPGEVWRSTDGGAKWTVSFAEPPASNTGSAGGGQDDATAVQCAGPDAAWTLLVGSGAAMGHEPYLAYATQDARHWHALLEETYTESAIRPGVRAPDGPGSYPGPFSAISPQEAAYVGWTPPEGYGAAPMDLITGGTTLAKEGNVGGLTQPYAAAFASATQGWVVGTDQTSPGRQGATVIEHTADAGKTWTRQYAAG